MIKRLLHRWFNTPPALDAPFITDKSGEKFWTHWDDIDCLSVWYRGWPAGRVNLDFKTNGKVILADIIVFNSYPRSHRNLRKRGLGKAMLQEAIRYAREHGAKLMWGWIQPDENTTVEYLVDWYRRQGFQVNDNLGIFLEIKDADNEKSFSPESKSE